MESRQREIRHYRTKNGTIPFQIWFGNLEDIRAKTKIGMRLERAEAGNFGDCNSVGDGVHEMKINFGPGYRIYFGQEGMEVIILLCGGDKSTQQKDILTAKGYWADYHRRKNI